MKVTKEIQMNDVKSVSPEDMAAINRFTKREHKPEEVFAFEILLCDNDIDRDCERFTAGALKVLEHLFLGKTGIFDHTWSATGQKARIFKTEVIRETGKFTADGEDYVCLKGSAYMLRTEQNAELIAEIEGGIKKEVSIGCSVAKSTCSICGADTAAGCGHKKGQMYGGKICCTVLDEPTDAYEWSFVAVPAQKKAGILKRFAEGKAEEMTLKEFVTETGDVKMAAELRELEYSANVGKGYLKSLREEVIRLGVAAECGFQAELLKSAVEKMGEAELTGFKKAFTSKLDSMYPPACQLGGYKQESDYADREEFRI